LLALILGPWNHVVSWRSIFSHSKQTRQKEKNGKF